MFKYLDVNVVDVVSFIWPTKFRIVMCRNLAENDKGITKFK